MDSGSAGITGAGFGSDCMMPCLLPSMVPRELAALGAPAPLKRASFAATGARPDGVSVTLLNSRPLRVRTQIGDGEFPSMLLR